MGLAQTNKTTDSLFSSRHMTMGVGPICRFRSLVAEALKKVEAVKEERVRKVRGHTVTAKECTVHRQELIRAGGLSKNM